MNNQRVCKKKASVPKNQGFTIVATSKLLQYYNNGNYITAPKDMPVPLPNPTYCPCKQFTFRTAMNNHRTHTGFILYTVVSSPISFSYFICLSQIPLLKYHHRVIRLPAFYVSVFLSSGHCSPDHHKNRISAPSFHFLLSTV